MADERIAAMDDERLATLTRALGHPARMRIVRLLATQTECRGADVFSQLPLAQSTVSEHLRVLKDAGIVIAHPEGAGMVYCVIRAALDDLSDGISAIAREAPDCAVAKAPR
jgi:ArsR family transcriptional regulator, arsenate/arsenite/antimonite-responsive transcriptional repressor